MTTENQHAANTSGEDLLPLECPQGGGPGDAPGGLNILQILSYVPLVLPLISGLLSGSTEIPAFTVRIAGKRKRIGPIPVSDI